VLREGAVDPEATERRRLAIRRQRIGREPQLGAPVDAGQCVAGIGPDLLIRRNGAALEVVSRHGAVLAVNSTRWRANAVSVTHTGAAPGMPIALHEHLAVTAQYCPRSGTLLAVDVHERGQSPVDDVELKLEQWSA
jgi:N-methylhydantoinase B